MFTYSVTRTNTRLHIPGKLNISLFVKELSLFDHIAAIPVLWDPAHQQGHPVQVIRSSCHVATLQYTVRIRQYTWHHLVWWGGPRERSWYIWHHLVWWGGPRERSWSADSISSTPHTTIVSSLTLARQSLS
jgi:hypothetical protein